MTADIIAYNSENQPVLVVEVKNQKGVDTSSAEKYKHYLGNEGILSNGKYFLLASPEKFYLWKDANKKQPDYIISSESFLKPYYPMNSVLAKNLSAESFELIVSAWLRSILLADDKKDIQDKDLHWLLDSGLYEKLKNGHLILEGKHWVV